MSSVREIRDVGILEQRAASHKGLADVLFETGHEWAAVASFYAAYQLARAAFIKDPIFDSNRRIEIDPRILPEDRYATTHQGGGPKGAKLGVTDLVTRLYRPIAGRYSRLHIASMQVRYSDRLIFPLDRLRADYTVIESEYQAGHLICS